jgi:hypothetical protein
MCTFSIPLLFAYLLLILFLLIFSFPFLTLACHFDDRSVALYLNSKKLINGVTLTYSEEDSRKVKNQLKSFLENLDNKLINVQTRLNQMKSVTMAYGDNSDDLLL